MLLRPRGKFSRVCEPPSLLQPPASSYPSTPSGQHGSRKRHIGVLISPSQDRSSSSLQVKSNSSASSPSSPQDKSIGPAAAAAAAAAAGILFAVAAAAFSSDAVAAAPCTTAATAAAPLVGRLLLLPSPLARDDDLDLGEDEDSSADTFRFLGDAGVGGRAEKAAPRKGRGPCGGDAEAAAGEAFVALALVTVPPMLALVLLKGAAAMVRFFHALRPLSLVLVALLLLLLLVVVIALLLLLRMVNKGRKVGK